ncbi:hypothetical protein ACLB2K_046762 [Fragaria x ananassa]
MKAFLEESHQWWDTLKKALQCLNVKPTIDEHILAKTIELPSSRSTVSPLEESTSKEEIILSINDEELGVKAGGVLDKNPISKIDVVSQRLKVGQNSPP